MSYSASWYQLKDGRGKKNKEREREDLVLMLKVAPIHPPTKEITAPKNQHI